MDDKMGEIAMPINETYAQAVGKLNVLREKLRREHNALEKEARIADGPRFEADNMVVSIEINRLRMNPPEADLEAMDTEAELRPLKTKVGPKG